MTFVYTPPAQQPQEPAPMPPCAAPGWAFAADRQIRRARIALILWWILTVLCAGGLCIGVSEVFGLYILASIPGFLLGEVFIIAARATVASAWRPQPNAAPT